MKTSAAKGNCRAGIIRVGYVVLMGLVMLPFLLVYAITGYVRLGSDTAALRDSVMRVAPAKTRVVVNVGSLTVGVARMVAGFFPLPPEARMAMRSVGAAEVGVYRVERGAASIDRGQVMRDADKAMARRGWDRVVGVCKDGDLVAVFMPQKGISADRIKCCVLVLHDEDLVVVAARGNVREVMEFATEKFNLQENIPVLARR